MSDGPPKRTLHPELSIFDPGLPIKAGDPPKIVASFFAVPSFFTDNLMLPQVSKGIPYSFWKFTFVVLREMLAPGKDGYTYEFNTTSKWFATEFGIDKGSTQDWSNAYSVSGLFLLKKGTKQHPEKPGTPTVWLYNRKATRGDWTAFVVALSKVLSRPGDRMKRHGKGADDLVAADAFKLALACQVDKQRVLHELPPVNVHKIEKWISEGKANAKRNEDGSFDYQYARPAWGFKEPDYHAEE